MAKYLKQLLVNKIKQSENVSFDIHFGTYKKDMKYLDIKQNISEKVINELQKLNKKISCVEKTITVYYHYNMEYNVDTKTGQNICYALYNETSNVIYEPFNKIDLVLRCYDKYSVNHLLFPSLDEYFNEEKRIVTSYYLSNLITLNIVEIVNDDKDNNILVTISGELEKTTDVDNIIKKIQKITNVIN